MFAWCPQKTEEGVRSPGIGVTEDCEPRNLDEYEEPNLSLLQEQQVCALNIAQSLQPHLSNLKKKISQVGYHFLFYCYFDFSKSPIFFSLP